MCNNRPGHTHLKNLLQLGLLSFVLLMIIESCREPFFPTLDVPSTGYLVVEGNINADGITQISLSRTRKFSEAINVPELKAQVEIRGESSGVYSLQDKGKGLYESDVLTLPEQQRYRLRIKTADGKEYVSTFLKYKRTPPIDSISWRRNEKGIAINVHAHDDNNSTQYYKWDFRETWEIRSTLRSTHRFVLSNQVDPVTREPIIGIIERTRDESDAMFFCWKENTSKQILVGSTARLSKDIVNFPMVTIPNKDERLGWLYSLNVRQIALDREGYEFFQIMKNNTETNGSIFDRQPSEVKGNINCTTNPEELVLGYIGLSSLVEKRIFINGSALKNWGFEFNCAENFVITANQDTIRKYAGATEIIGVTIDPSMPTIINLSNKLCADCNMRGFSRRPAFWPANPF